MLGGDCALATELSNTSVPGMEKALSGNVFWSENAIPELLITFLKVKRQLEVQDSKFIQISDLTTGNVVIYVADFF